MNSSDQKILFTNNFDIEFSNSQQYFRLLLEKLGYKLFASESESDSLESIQQYLINRQQIFDNSKQYCNDALAVCILQNNNCDTSDNLARTKRLIRNVRSLY